MMLQRVEAIHSITHDRAGVVGLGTALIGTGLAKLSGRIGTTQPVIARLEGGQESPSFLTLHRYAETTGTRLAVELVRTGD